VFRSFRSKNLKRGILFKKLGWTVLHRPTICEAFKKSYCYWFFGEKFDISYFYSLDVVFTFLSSEHNRIGKTVKFSKRYFVSISEIINFKFNQSTRKFENVFPLIYSVDNLQKAWRVIKSKRSSSVIGKDVPNYLGLILFEKIAKQLELGRYKYSSIKKVAMLKRCSLKKKVVLLSSFYDIIIQQAFFFVLKQIYGGVSVWRSVSYSTFKTYLNNRFFDRSALRRFVRSNNKYEIKKWIIHPIFSPNFFSSSSNQSAHAALEKIKFSWVDVAWFWSVQLSKNCDSIHYHRLVNEMEKTIDDKRLIHEAWKMFKCGVVSLKKSIKSSGGMNYENILSLFRAMS
jgi:retron-type reverse transcriptase